ncbi:hypothetical protein HD554DRAFT_394551 [Boletus coccyginus]|nr:hypothetical protein HD554DRAFT_394551 [Boletus coccyginus]
MFPKFSSRGRGGKQPDVVPPPHTIYNRGRCTLQIGPHLFVDTTVFEVHYRPLPVAVSQPTTFVYQSAPGNSLSQAVHQPQTLSSSSSASAGESNALLSSLSSTLPVTPGLVSQVNAAATSNPTLANLLQLAASGRATPDQLKTLGLLIQSLTSSQVTDILTTISQGAPGTDSSSTPLPTAPAATQQYQYQQTVKDFDIVIEFRDAPSDRWIFPRGPATCESVSTLGDSGSIGDLAVSTIVPFPSMTLQDPPASETNAPTELPSKQVVEFHFKMASSYIWDTFSRWVGPKERMEENRKILMEIESPEQKYLAYRLPEGSQLSQIQNAALPSYPMKPIKPSTESGRPKRRSAPRKSAQDQSSPTTKRKRQTLPKTQVPPPKIACFACGQANVPLIMGGRYCRPCVDGGRIGGTSQVTEVAMSNKLSIHDSSQSLPKSVDSHPSPDISTVQEDSAK